MKVYNNMLHFLSRANAKDSNLFDGINAGLLELVNEANGSVDDEKMGNMATQNTKAPKFNFGLYNEEGGDGE